MLQFLLCNSEQVLMALAFDMPQRVRATCSAQTNYTLIHRIVPFTVQPCLSDNVRVVRRAPAFLKSKDAPRAGMQCYHRSHNKQHRDDQRPPYLPSACVGSSRAPFHHTSVHVTPFSRFLRRYLSFFVALVEVFVPFVHLTHSNHPSPHPRFAGSVKPECIARSLPRRLPLSLVALLPRRRSSST